MEITNTENTYFLITFSSFFGDNQIDLDTNDINLANERVNEYFILAEMSSKVEVVLKPKGFYGKVDKWDYE